MVGGRRRGTYLVYQPRFFLINHFPALTRVDENYFLRLGYKNHSSVKCVIKPYDFTVLATRFRTLYCFPSSGVCFSENVSLVFSENNYLISTKTVAPSSA